MKSLSDLCFPVKDQCDPATSGASVYVGLEHLRSGAFFLASHGTPAEVQSAKTRFRKGDILYGKLRPYLDKAVLALCDGICSTDILPLRPKAGVCPAYLLALVHSHNFREHADQTTNGVNHPRTSWPGLATFQHQTPEEPVQQKLAALLWKTQRAIEAEANLVTAARGLMFAAMHQLFTVALRDEPSRQTDLGPIPASWQLEPINAKAKLIAGGTPTRGVKEYWEGGTIPWVKTGEVDYCIIKDTEEKITRTGLENSAAKILPKGTLLIAMYGQGITRGKVAILGIDACTNQACAGIIPTSEDLLTTFLYYYLAYSYDRLRSLSHGAQQQNLNAELVGSFPVPIPEKAEQQEIVHILETFDRKISLHERKRDTLQDLFQTMLHQLMTAQIRVDKLDIDTNEVRQ